MTCDEAPEAPWDWRTRFIEAFGGPAAWAVQAPGRVNLIGEHVDYCGGPVLPMAIQSRAVVAARPSPDGCVRIRSTAFPGCAARSPREASATRPDGTSEAGGQGRSPSFASRLFGVLDAFERGPWAAERSPARLPPLEILVHSSVPVGGGLSSSAATTAALALLASGLAADAASGPAPPPGAPPVLHFPWSGRDPSSVRGPRADSTVELGLSGKEVEAGGVQAADADRRGRRAAGRLAAGAVPGRGLVRILARVCQWAEHEAAGVPCGIMDMLISLAGCQGHALLLDCERMTWEEVPFPEEGRLLVIDTGVRHDHSSGAYAQRHRECQEAASVLGVESLAQAGVDAATHGGLSCTLRSRALHVVSECRRVREFAVAMEAGDLSRMGRLLTESHLSLRDHFEVSTPELDHVVAMSEALRGEGVLGARLTGGGFGGCAIVLLRREAARTAATELSEAYERRFKRRPSMFMAEASAGAEWLFSVD